MKTILLMTDFSENARNAIYFAIGAFGQQVNYLLVNTFVMSDSTMFMPLPQLELLRKKSKEGLESELKLIRSEFPEFTGLQIKLMSESAEPHAALERIARKSPFDLVVMGTKGASGLKKVFIGTVTASIIRNSSLPVLVVPEEATYDTLERIGFAVDLNSNKNASTIRPLVQIAEQFKSEIMLIHVVPQGAKYDTILEADKRFDSLKGLRKSWHTVEADNVATGIDRFCSENQVGLLVAVARHNRFFSRIFHRSITQQLVYHTRLPMLILDDSYSTE